MTANLGLIFLAVAVIAMIVGPIMMMQPSASQRRQEQLRSRAIELGLRVRIVSLPRQATDIETPGAIPRYCLPRVQVSGDEVAPWLLLRGAYAHEAHFFEQWAWYGKDQAAPLEQQWLRIHLPRLPKSVTAVGNTREGVSVYWSEAGGEKVLLGIAELLRGFPDR